MIALWEDSATTLCRFGRLCVAKIRMQRRWEEFDEEIRRSFLLKIRASTKIAAGWRGKLGRVRAKDARVIRAQRCKAMFSPAEQ